MSRILNEASQELEIDAQKALSGLQEDKEIMRRLQQVKQRRKESSGDVNKGLFKWSINWMITMLPFIFGIVNINASLNIGVDHI